MDGAEHSENCTRASYQTRILLFLTVSSGQKALGTHVGSADSIKMLV